MLGGMGVERSTRRDMPDWIALILISLASLGFVTCMLLVGAAIDRVFFSG